MATSATLPAGTWQRAAAAARPPVPRMGCCYAGRCGVDRPVGPAVQPGAGTTATGAVPCVPVLLPGHGGDVGVSRQPRVLRLGNPAQRARGGSGCESGAAG